jgi:mycoredoxin
MSSAMLTGAVIFLVVYTVWMIVANLPRRDRATSYGGADHDAVVLYWRPGCRYCMRLRMRLRFTGLRHQEINIWKDPEAAAFVRSVNGGNETVPTVTVTGRTMINPAGRELLAAVEAHAPHLLPVRPGREER